MKALHDCDKKVSFSTNKLDIGGGDVYIHVCTCIYLFFIISAISFSQVTVCHVAKHISIKHAFPGIVSFFFLSYQAAVVCS